MNVLHISVRADVGGGPRHILYVLKGTERIINNFVAAPSGHAYSQALNESSRAFFSIPHRRFSLLSFFLLFRQLRKMRFDLIHSHGRGGGIYARLLGLLLHTPVVHTHHGLYFENYSHGKKAALVLLEQFLSSITKKIIFVSESEFFACQKSGACAPHKSVIIPNGIEIFPAVRRTLYSGPLRLLAITRLDKEKNNSRLIEIVNACMTVGLELKLNIAGDGPERSLLEQLAKKLNVDHLIEFLGNCSNVSELIAESDIYVTCSHGEAHSLAMIEAMAGGLAVVATNVRGHVDMVRNGSNGYLFQASDCDTAVSILKNFSFNRDHIIECGENGRRLVADYYSCDRMVSRMLNLYNDVLKP